ncbi:MAG: 4Fe-4S dicluster domain-containing protein [Nitrospirota bacterium]|nr:4Fe-4S dicluster domain-containing protein [Nitrospirota bacterium]
MIFSTGSYSQHRYASIEEVAAQAGVWLEAGEIGMVVGYGRQSPFTDLAMPNFVNRVELLATELVWNQFCDYNLLGYAKLGAREAARGKGGVAVMVKPCELHNLDILTEEGNMSGVTRDNVRPIVMRCTGIVETKRLNAYTREMTDLRVQTKCLDCPEYTAAHGAGAVAEQKAGREDYQAYRKLIEDDAGVNWGVTLDKCLHCYACRNICPSCYCTQGCPADEAATAHVTNALKVIKGIDASRQLVYNLVRTWHIQPRCSECQECERVCPVGIPIMALKAKLGRDFDGEGSPGDVIGFLTNFAARITPVAPPGGAAPSEAAPT